MKKYSTNYWWKIQQRTDYWRGLLTGKQISLLEELPNWVWKVNDFLPFEKAREYVRKLGLKNQVEWYAYCKSNKRPDNIPSHPQNPYEKEWVSWGDWLGTNRVSNSNKRFLSFEEARIFVRILGLKSLREWYKYCKSGERPPNITTCPDRIYKTEWVSWKDWLGTEWMPFEEAKWVVQMLGLKSQIEWNVYSKSGKRPYNMPASPPRTYKGEWVSWADWLGY